MTYECSICKVTFEASHRERTYRCGGWKEMHGGAIYLTMRDGGRTRTSDALCAEHANPTVMDLLDWANVDGEYFARHLRTRTSDIVREAIDGRIDPDVLLASPPRTIKQLRALRGLT